MIKIRQGVFETNSSSTHSLTMMMKEDYLRWKDGNYMYTERAGYYSPINPELQPEEKVVYTPEEVCAFLMNDAYFIEHSKNLGLTEAPTPETLAEYEPYEYGFDTNYDGSDRLEDYYDEFTTPNGETIVAFGQYGYEG